MTSHNYFTAACMVLTFAFSLWRGEPRHFWLSVGFFASCIGDLFLANRHGRLSFFIGGVVAFSVAHTMFFLYAWQYGRHPNWLIGGVAFALLCAWPAIPTVLRVGWQIGVAVSFYTAFSCATLASVSGMKAPWPQKGLFLLGVLLLIFSDAMIAQSNFLGMKRSGKLIIPTYVASHVCMLASWAVCMARGLFAKMG